MHILAVIRSLQTRFYQISWLYHVHWTFIVDILHDKKHRCRFYLLLTLSIWSWTFWICDHNVSLWLINIWVTIEHGNHIACFMANWNTWNCWVVSLACCQTISTGNRGMWLYVKWRTFFQDYLDSIIWFKAQCEWPYTTLFSGLVLLLEEIFRSQSNWELREGRGSSDWREQRKPWPALKV